MELAWDSRKGSRKGSLNMEWDCLLVTDSLWVDPLLNILLK
jgi:hypothetical protein